MHTYSNDNNCRCYQDQLSLLPRTIVVATKDQLSLLPRSANQPQNSIVPDKEVAYGLDKYVEDGNIHHEVAGGCTRATLARIRELAQHRASSIGVVRGFHHVPVRPITVEEPANNIDW